VKERTVEGAKRTVTSRAHLLTVRCVRCTRCSVSWHRFFSGNVRTR